MKHAGRPASRITVVCWDQSGESCAKKHAEDHRFQHAAQRNATLHGTSNRVPVPVTQTTGQKDTRIEQLQSLTSAPNLHLWGLEGVVHECSNDWPWQCPWRMFPVGGEDTMTKGKRALNPPTRWDEQRDHMGDVVCGPDHRGILFLWRAWSMQGATRLRHQQRHDQVAQVCSYNASCGRGSNSSRSIASLLLRQGG